MRTIRTICVLIGIAIQSGPNNAAAQPPARAAAPCDPAHSEAAPSVDGGVEPEVAAFILALQKAVASNDRRNVATMVRYPVSAWAKNQSVTIRNADAFVARYDLIFTPRLKKTIAEARPECVFSNAKGMMIHDGEIWFNAFTTDQLKIITINRPIGPPEK